MILDGEPSYSDPPEVWEQWILHLKTLRRKQRGNPVDVLLLDDAIEDAEHGLEHVKRTGSYREHRFT